MKTAFKTNGNIDMQKELLVQQISNTLRSARTSYVESFSLQLKQIEKEILDDEQVPQEYAEAIKDESRKEIAKLVGVSNDTTQKKCNIDFTKERLIQAVFPLLSDCSQFFLHGLHMAILLHLDKSNSCKKTV